MTWYETCCTCLYRQGDEGDNFYVIGAGMFIARILQPDGQEKTVYTYEGKGAFGELALMYNCPRAATVQVYLSSVLCSKNILLCQFSSILPSF